jgi:hypothetical protein
MHAFRREVKIYLMKKTIVVNLLMQLAFYALVYLITLL